MRRRKQPAVSENAPPGTSDVSITHAWLIPSLCFPACRYFDRASTTLLSQEAVREGQLGAAGGGQVPGPAQGMWPDAVPVEEGRCPILWSKCNRPTSSFSTPYPAQHRVYLSGMPGRTPGLLRLAPGACLGVFFWRCSLLPYFRVRLACPREEK